MKVLYHHRTRATDAQRVHILEIVNAFRRLGHEVEIASVVPTEKTSHDPRDEVAASRWKQWVLRIPLAYEAMQLAYNLFALPWLWRRLRSRRTDLLYERYSLFNFAGVLAAHLNGTPVVLEVNSPFALEQHLHKEIKAVRFARWAERWICNMATRTLVVSGPLRRILVESGVRESQLMVMPNGVNLEHLRSGGDESQLREALGLQGRVVIGFAGWFRPWHGLEFLIGTFAAAAFGERDAALLLIGDGPATAALRAAVEKHGLGRAVVLTGPVPHERIPAYLNCIDIAVQPAANEYCCPMKIVEYMGLAKAIVAPRQENIEELLVDGEDALLFQPGDSAAFAEALGTLISDSGLRHKLGQQAFEALQRRGLLWTRNAERVIEIVTGEARDSRATGVNRAAAI